MPKVIIGVGGTGPLHYYITQEIPATKEDKSLTKTKPEKNESPANAVIPVVYGRDKVDGRFVYLKIISSKLHAIFVFCEGEIDSYEKIFVDDKDISTMPNIVTEKYYGTMTQSVCSLSRFDPSWNSRLAGTAYIYFTISGTSDLPSISAIIRGKKVYNPATGAVAYSSNPALHLADLFTNKRYGLGYEMSQVDWTSVQNVAAYCDTVLSGGGKRYEFGYCFNEASPASDAINIITSHFLGVVLADEKIKFDCGRPRSVVASYTESEIFNMQILETDAEDLANRISFRWKFRETWEEITSYVEDPRIASHGHEIYEKSYDLTGCTTYSQALRIAHFLLNSRLQDLRISFDTYNGKGLEPLDVISVTHSIGLSEKLFYVSSIELKNDDIWSITAIEYDPAVYTDAVVSDPTYPDTELPNPDTVPSNVDSLTLSEITEQLRDSSWISKIRIQWSDTWYWTKHFNVYLKKGNGDYFRVATTNAQSYEYGPADEMVEHFIKVTTVSITGRESAGSVASIIPLGKYAVPTWKQGAAITGVEAGDIVFLRWYQADGTAPATDIDIVGYEIRRGYVTNTWENALFITFVDSLTYIDKNCPAGLWRYFIKAKDSVGNYTATAKTVDVTVTPNPFLGFTQEFNFDLLLSSHSTS